VLCEVNLSGAQLIGEERVNLAGRLLRNYVAPNYRPTFNAFITKLFADHCTASCEVEFINARKRPFFAHLEANVDEAGNHCFIVVKDITGARIVDQAVERAHQELEDRVRERTAELVRANEQLTAEIAKRTQAEAALTQTEQMLRQLAAHQDLIKEEERKRIAREIHDDLGQNLLALRLDVSMLHARTGASHPKLNKRTAEALQQIDVTMKSVRSIINNLRPNTLDLGLTAAIEWQMADFQRRSRIDCQFIVDEKDFMADLDENLSAALFRIVQESLTNVIQHAQASKVVITLRRNEANLLMTVADNGVGFVPGRKRQATPFGLMGIRERVGRLGGDLVIDSGRGNGTTLAVSIPIPAAA
jgi:signal transduction histidine kinase